MRAGLHSRIAVALSVVLMIGACSPHPETPKSSDSPVVTTATAPVAEAAPPGKQYAIADFIDTTSIFGASFSADEKRILFSSNKTGVWNAYTMPTGGGDWSAVTSSATDNNYAVSYFPADERKLVTRDQGGNELDHLYVIELDGSEKDLTPGDKLKADFLGFNHAGSAFYVATNERDAKFFDLYRYDASTYARKRVYEIAQGLDLGPVSSDGRYLALTKTRTTNDNDLHLVELASGKSVHLTPHEGDASFSAEDFSPDGKYLYYTSNQGSEFSRI